MLDISGLHKRYGDSGAFAVDDVNLRIEEGEFFTLLGPSGCGKTTTLRCVAGLETATSGVITIGGEVVYSSSSRRVVPVNRRDISMVFQSYAIWPHMTVAQNVAFPLESMHVPKSEIGPRVARTLEMVGLDGFADRPAPMLSGGQQQRVAFARAVIKDAKLLLLDEPLSNLDAKMRTQMRDELRSLQQRLGMTTIYVTHDQDEALSLSDRIAVMNQGKVVEIGSPLDLYMRPRDVFTARFVGQADLLAGEVVGETSDVMTVRTALGPLRCAVFPRSRRGRVQVLVRPEHIRIAGDGERPPTSDNVVDDAVVTAVTFSGKLLEYVVDVHGHALRVQTLAGSPRAVGERVRLAAPVERCLVLDGDVDGNPEEDMIGDTPLERESELAAAE